jgi:hypothetical protein
MTEERFARQVLMFKVEGQRKIESQPVAIVGLGGMGSQVAQSLAFLGVRNFLLIDDDRVDETNLNRLAGACAKDVGQLKVEVVRDLIRKINPGAEVVAIAKNLRTRAAMEPLITYPIIFGCVDQDGPRLILTELAAAYENTLIDLASEIFPAANDRALDFGGRVVVARAGDYCLFCARQIDHDQARQDLESPEIRELNRIHGYGLGDTGPAPAVFSLNGIIANLGVTEFLAMVTGFREPARKLTYLGMRGAVRDTADASDPDCFTCKCLRGMRERANLWRYIPEMPETTVAK